jgi:hypothetical protein
MTAAEKILQKALIGSNIDTSQWNRIQAALRDRAFFSSKVESARMLHSMRAEAAKVAAGIKSESEVRRDLRQAFAAEGYRPKPGDEGTIKDLYTRHRLDTIIQTNVRQARGFVQYLDGISPGALAAFPAQELIRVRNSKAPRNWTKRWTDAGGKLRGGRMIALKTDPIWTKISAFGNPFPPYDWGSGMGIRDIKKSEAKALGVILDDEAKAEAAKRRDNVNLNGTLQAEISMRNDSSEAKKLISVFEDQIRFDGNTVKWQGELIRDVLKGKVKKAKLGRGFDGRNLSISHTIFKEHLSKHFGEAESHGNNKPLTPQDYDLLPTIWRSPDSVSKSKGNDHLTLLTMDGHTLNLFVHPKKGIVSFYKTKNPGGA